MYDPPGPAYPGALPPQPPPGPGRPPVPPPGRPPPGRPPPPARRPWAVTAPEGSPFHRLAHTEVRRWWRPPLSLLLIVLGAVVTLVAVLVFTLFLVIVIGLAQGVSFPAVLDGAQPLGNPVVFLAIALGSLALLVPVVPFVVWLIERRPASSVVSVERRPRWRWLLVCAGLALVAQVVGMVGLYVSYSVALPGDESSMFGWAGWATFLPGAAVAVLLVPFQATAEELVFRGWLLQAFGAYLRSPWPGIVLSALAFAALHGYGIVGFVDVAVFGVLAGWLAVRTGGLEAPIALHVLHNVAAFLPAAAAGQLDEALRTTEVPWYVLTGTAVELAFFAAVVLVLARRRQVRRMS